MTTQRHVFHGLLGALRSGHGIDVYPNATGVVIEHSDAWEIELATGNVMLAAAEFPRVGDVEPIEGTYMRAGGYRFATPTDPYEVFQASFDDDPSSLAAGGEMGDHQRSKRRGGVA